MTILRGHFTMTLILGVPDEADRGVLEQDLETTAAQLGLEALSLKGVEAVVGAQPEPSHIVTVYGSDHPGIVCATAEAIARRGYNITDLNTRLVGDAEGDPLYALMMEVAIPPGDDGELEKAMSEVARAENLEVSVRELESDELCRAASAQVLRFPHPALKLTARSLEDADEAARVGTDLVDTMRSFPGCVGLAAPQLDEIVRMVVVDVSEHPKAPPPRTGCWCWRTRGLVHREGSEVAREGCLLHPGSHGQRTAGNEDRLEALTP